MQIADTQCEVGSVSGQISTVAPPATRGGGRPDAGKAGIGSE